MRVVVQRVTRASVEVDGAVVGQIDSGLVLFVGIGRDDVATPETTASGGGAAPETTAPGGDALRTGSGEARAEALADKVANLRIFPDDEGKSNLSLLEIGGSALVISQFTLYADLAKGRRPSWSAAAPGPVAGPLVGAVVQALRDLGARVETGIFGADMKVSLVNDGPVTIILDLP